MLRISVASVLFYTENICKILLIHIMWDSYNINPQIKVINKKN